MSYEVEVKVTVRHGAHRAEAHRDGGDHEGKSHDDPKSNEPDGETGQKISELAARTADVVAKAVKELAGLLNKDQEGKKGKPGQPEVPPAKPGGPGDPDHLHHHHVGPVGADKPNPAGQDPAEPPKAHPGTGQPPATPQPEGSAEGSGAPAQAA